jgi:hypothetical protein
MGQPPVLKPYLAGTMTWNRRLGGRLTESFDISPDGSRITVSFGSYTRNIMVANGVPGIEPLHPESW